MNTDHAQRKRPVNLTLSVNLVDELKLYTHNLSATAEELLTAYVVEQKKSQLSRQQHASAAVSDWNAVHKQWGSYADDHSTL